MKRLLIIIVLLSTLVALPVDALRIGDKVKINGINATIVDFKDGQPVYQALITPNLNSTESDGYSVKTSSVYANARTDTSAASVSDTTLNSTITNSFVSSTYIVNRGYLYFDTSTLSGFVISAGTLNLYVNSKADNNNESLQIQSGQPTYPHNPLVVGDFDLTNYAGNGGSKDITTFSLNAYNAITLDAGGLAMINTTGTTKLILRTTGDINNTTPTSSNFVQYYTSEAGTDLCPYLSLTFTALTPAVISVNESNVAKTSARLNSMITNGGGDTDCEIRFGYGTTTQTAVNFAAYDTITAWVAGYEQGDNPYLDITGLTAGTPYFYRVQVKNDLSTITSADEQTFTTIAAIADMSSLSGIPEDDNVSLDWIKADGATNTLIRCATNTYPATTADGFLVYSGGLNFYIHSGLTAGTTYYYSAWGESGGAYSTNEVNFVITTDSSISQSTSPSGSSPGGWMQNPDESFLANLQPFYSVINGLADNINMPRGNAWLALSLLFVLFVGVGLYIKFSSASLALFVMAVVMSLLIMLHILGVYMIFIIVVMALGGWATRPQAG